MRLDMSVWASFHFSARESAHTIPVKESFWLMSLDEQMEPFRVDAHEHQKKKRQPRPHSYRSSICVYLSMQSGVRMAGLR